MNFLRSNIKVLLGMLGLASNVSAQIQNVNLNRSASLKDEKEISLMDSAEHSESVPRVFQTVSEAELVDALQKNTLEDLLMKKGVLIKRPSADSTVCEKCIKEN